MKCPKCGAQTNGAFCSECGAPLKGAKCRECQAPLAVGARFCNNCGTPVAGRSRAESDGNKLPWIVAGAALVLLIVVLARPALRGDDQPEADGRVPLSQFDEAVGQGGPAAAGGPGPLSGSPRENADRLFNRVMSERESGDTAQARFFLPMAIQAYGMAGELDADGYYHLSVLQNFAGDHKAALSSAEKILATSPNHLLGLFAAAAAARAAGDDATARRYYQRFLSAYDTESKTTKQEYQDHGRMFPELKSEAEAFVRRG
jgi:tetratricopeptide (TPR) repeat protein